jgi:hypothetical protein
MKRVIFSILFLASISFADQTEYLFQQGVQAYQEGEYQTAREQFESALKHGKASAALYYNLGNAYYKMDEIGLAILNYERAKKMEPGDEDVEFNLNIAQLQVVDKIPSPEIDFFFKLWDGIKNILSLEQFALVTIILYVLLIVLIIMMLLVKNPRVSALARYSWVPALIVLMLISSIFVLRVRQDLTVKYGVILVDKVSVVSGPSYDSTEMFALHEGVKIQIIAQSGDFVRIRLTDGKDGWVPRGALDVI